MNVNCPSWKFGIDEKLMIEGDGSCFDFFWMWGVDEIGVVMKL
jgi:hypothetical protein